MQPRQSQHKAKRVPARRVPSITTTTKKELRDLDSGRCLITFEETPTASQQIVHIVTRKSFTTDLNTIETMWKASALNLDSTQNLITWRFLPLCCSLRLPTHFLAVRADWRLSYDHGDWAFVPAKHILRKILKYKGTSFDKPYPGFDPDELHGYVFVPLPSLRRHYILRLTEFDKDDGEGEDDDDDDNDNEGEDERDDEGENEDRERGERRAESGDEQEAGEDEQEMVDIEDGNATIHIIPFLGFPVLKHHANPFFVIYNALPKLRNHWLQLCTEHTALLMLMTDIEAIIFKAPSSSKLRKRCRSSNDGDDDDSDARPKCKTRGAAKRGNSELPGIDRTKTRGRANVSKGKGKTLGETTPRPAQQPKESQYLPPSPISQTVKAQHFLYDNMSEVAAWAVAVAAAGPRMRQSFGQTRSPSANRLKTGTGGKSRTSNLNSRQNFAVPIGPCIFTRSASGCRPIRPHGPLLISKCSVTFSLLMYHAKSGRDWTSYELVAYNIDIQEQDQHLFFGGHLTALRILLLLP